MRPVFTKELIERQTTQDDLVTCGQDHGNNGRGTVAPGKALYFLKISRGVVEKICLGKARQSTAAVKSVSIAKGTDEETCRMTSVAKPRKAVKCPSNKLFVTCTKIHMSQRYNVQCRDSRRYRSVQYTFYILIKRY